jgi:arylsulfatase I/J
MLLRMGMVSVAAVLLASATTATAVATAAQPHIFMVVVDDFGWADAGWHRGDGGGLPVTKEVVTPTMDQLVKEGIELNRHYVHMMCTPTRSSFQSGRLPIHVLTQLSSPCDRNGAIPRNMTGVAAQLKKAGYSTHQVGKWDCGMATPHHTPHGRGYDTSLNYFDHGNWMWTEAAWGGSYNHRGDIPLPEETIIDFWDTDKPAHTLNGTGYEEYLFRDRMTQIISAHDASTPLYLNYDSKVAHYPQQAPQEYQDKFDFITDSINRKMYHAMVTCLDDNLKNVTTQLKDKGMW